LFIANKISKNQSQDSELVIIEWQVEGKTEEQVELRLHG
jgi:hypothetical protein